MRAELILGMLEVVDRLQAALDFLRIKKFVAGKGDRADLVLPPFIKVKANHHFVGRRVIELRVLDFKIKIPATVVKLGELVVIVVEIVLPEHAAARQPGEHPAPFGLELFAQFLLGESRRADEINLLDFDLLRFGDFKGDRAPSRILVNVRNIFHPGAGPAIFFVKLLDFLAVAEHFLLVERLADFRGDFFPDFGITEFFVALNLDVRQPRPHLHHVGKHHSPVIGRFRRDADVVKLPGRIERVDVVLGGHGKINGAGFEADVGTNEWFADRRRADILHVHTVNFWAGRLRPHG